MQGDRTTKAASGERHEEAKASHDLKGVLRHALGRGCSGGTRGTAEEYCVRRAGIHMRAVAGIIGNGFRKRWHVFLRLEHF